MSDTANHAPTPSTPEQTAPTHPAQPGLQSLSKSFEPAALEAHWGPEWEKRGYGVAGYRGTSTPDAAAAAQGKNFSIQLPPPNVTATAPF